MKLFFFRLWGLSVLGLIQVAQAADGSCLAVPLDGRELYVRGSLNGWSAAEAPKFTWLCDHYELLTDIRGEHGFNVGDEDWTLDANFGRGSNDSYLALNGPELKRRFEGVSRLRLVLGTPGSQSVLSVDTVGGTLPVRAPPPPVSDSVAASVQFDFRNLQDKRPFGAASVTASHGVLQVTLPPLFGVVLLPGK